MYLLDTVVLSELRKKTGDRHVLAWLHSVRQEDIYISVLTVFEIVTGIERRRSTDPAFADATTHWLNQVIAAYGDRILPFTLDAARRWGRLAAQLGNVEIDLGIAATALENGLTVATRNVSDFVPTGVATVDPFRPRNIRP